MKSNRASWKDTAVGGLMALTVGCGPSCLMIAGVLLVVACALKYLFS